MNGLALSSPKRGSSYYVCSTYARDHVPIAGLLLPFNSFHSIGEYDSTFVGRGFLMAVPVATKVRNALHRIVMVVRRQYLARVWQMDIGEGAYVSLSAKLDKTNPRGIHIGKYTSITFGAAILTHDYINNRHSDVYI